MGFPPVLAKLFRVVYVGYFVVDMGFVVGMGFVVVDRGSVFGMGSVGTDYVVDKEFVGAGSVVGTSSTD